MWSELAVEARLQSRRFRPIGEDGRVRKAGISRGAGSACRDEVLTFPGTSLNPKAPRPVIMRGRVTKSLNLPDMSRPPHRGVNSVRRDFIDARSATSVSPEAG